MSGAEDQEDDWEPELDREDCFNGGVCPLCGREYDSPDLTEELERNKSYRMDVCILPTESDAGTDVVILHAVELEEKETGEQ